MTVDGQGARPLTARERRELARIERGLRSAGQGAARTPRAGLQVRPGALASCLGAGCAALTATALLAGPGVALLLAVAGAAALLATIVGCERRGDP